jgi:hypothetical protein
MGALGSKLPEHGSGGLKSARTATIQPDSVSSPGNWRLPCRIIALCWAERPLSVRPEITNELLDSSAREIAGIAPGVSRPYQDRL